MDPKAELLAFPDGYGTPTKTIPWEDIRGELEHAKHYWVGTTRPDGRPHVVPLDGIWLDDVLYYGGAPDTIHHRNVVENPEVSVNLPDTVRVVILEGAVGRAGAKGELAERLVTLNKEKYGYALDVSIYESAFAFRPRRGLAWTEFPTDATRFVFDGDEG